MEDLVPAIGLVYQKNNRTDDLCRQLLQLRIQNTVQKHIDATRPGTHFRIAR